ncbi:MAG: hypothetical protein ACFE8B_12625 [Candidatus Hermodarchaeota archaeon]
MITWILGGIILFWILLKRFSQDGKVENEPLGMPRGTVRALITLMIVSFPFGYLFKGDTIPPLIINSIFIVIAFYFEARKGTEEQMKEIINEIKRTDLETVALEEEKMPLYLPKYTVRFLLILTLIILQVLIILSPSISFQATNTLADILLIVGLFMIGALFRSISKAREKKNLREQISEMDASLNEVEIIEKLMLKEPSWWKSTGKSLLSILMLITTTTALMFYTFDFDYEILSLTQYGIELTLRGILLLLINVYYGLRD